MISFDKVSDRDLLEMCRRGDDDAWRYLYGYVLTICTWYKASLHADPKDIAQDVVLHLIDKAMEEVKKENSFRCFVKRITVNRILDHLKSVGPKRTVPIDQPIKNHKGEEFVPEYVDPEPTPEPVLASLEIALIIDAALKRLAGTCEKVLSEYFKYKIGFYEDYQELSAVLQMPVPTVSSHVRRCLNRLVGFEEIRAMRL